MAEGRADRPQMVMTRIDGPNEYSRVINPRNTRELYDIFYWAGLINVNRDHEAARLLLDETLASRENEGNSCVQMFLRLLCARWFWFLSLIMATVAFAGCFCVFPVLRSDGYWEFVTAIFVIVILIICLKYPIANCLYKKWYGSEGIAVNTESTPNAGEDTPLLKPQTESSKTSELETSVEASFKTCAETSGEK